VAGVLSCLLVGGAVGGALSGTARADSAPVDPANPATPTTVTADALPTMQIDGVAWSQVVVGNTVYVAGKFGFARPAGAAPGTQQTVRNNLLAYDIRTGELITSFAPDLNGQALVVTASPDGSRIYVGGDFTRANGQVRNKIAAYSTATGALVPDFRPSVSGQVRAIAATSSTVYLGGNVSAVGSVGRSRMAAVNAANGALLPWAPVPGTGPTNGNTDGNTSTNSDVLALVVTGGGNQVVAAGRFDSLNGQKATGVGALDPVSGATRPFAINQSLTNQGSNSAVYSLWTDGSIVYGTGYTYFGPGNLEGVFAVDANGGRIRWVSDCFGDSYGSYVSGGAVYVSSHAHACSNIGAFPEQQGVRVHKFATALSGVATGKVGPYTLTNKNFAGQPAPSQLNWYPTLTAGSATGQDQASWSVSGNGQYVVYGGEFPQVNGTAQQGLVRFAMPGTAPGRMSPTGAGLTPTVVSTDPGTARVSWTESTDQDNENLTYRVYRDNGTTPVYEVTSASTWYDVGTLAFTDRGLSAGTHTYRVGVVDPSGNRNTGNWTSVTVAAGSTATRSYAELVRADGASGLWSLGERSGTTVYDRIGGADLTVNPGVALGQAGAIARDGDTAGSFNGSSTGYAATKTPVLGPQTFSVEAWVNTTSKAGGKVVGYGTGNTAPSPNYDRHVYMDAAGRLSFGVYWGEIRAITSPAAYNDGRWHHVVASVGQGTMRLYVDGKQVATRTDVTSGGEPGYGYWRIGGDNTWAGAMFLNGRIDEVALYPKVLTAAEVTSHQVAGSTGTAVNIRPTASFTSSAAHLTASLDGSPSTDPDGSIAAWSWNFGDGSTGTGRTATHAYPATGTYGVTLTVTDDKGATATRTASVTVTAPPPNVPPAAAFTIGGTGLTASFDGTGSSDGDGQVTSYAWDFGDGTKGTGATALHTYALGGSYPVTLTVTDDDGATANTARQATVAAPTASTVLAADGFQRSVTGGLGTADTGGAWTAQAGATRQSVVPGTATLNLAAAGNNTGSYLAGVLQTSVDLRTSVSLSAAPTGGGTFVYVTGRRVAAQQEYRARLRFLANGTVGVAVTRLAGSATETLVGGEVVVPGVTYMAGTALQLRLQVSGTGTTTVSATVWAAGAAEPATPTVTRTDTTASLQSPGGLALAAYQSGSSTAPVAVRFSALTATPVGAVEPAPAPAPVPVPVPAPNVAPTARFTAGAAGLVGTVDGAASTDIDGSIAGYRWDFGDGTTGNGAQASHTYGAAGTYQVVLTVTDDDGATGTLQQPVTVTAPAAPVPPAPQPPATPGVLAADAFQRSVTGGLGTADTGGAWTASAGPTRQSVAPGTATLNLAAAGNNTGSYLAGVAETAVDLRTSLSLSAAPTGSGTSVYVTGRRVAAQQEYRARLRFLTNGTVAVGVTRLSGSAAETLVGGEVVMPQLTYRAGDVLQVRLQVSGTGTTTVAATVWADGTTEPAAPTVTRTDTTASLQAPGGVGLAAYLSGSSTAPVAVRFGALTVAVLG
jgi:PKD repeat protein